MNLDVLYEDCGKGHPHVSRAREIQGGVPCITGTQVTISEILARLYVHQSVSAVVNYSAATSLKNG